MKNPYWLLFVVVVCGVLLLTALMNLHRAETGRLEEQRDREFNAEFQQKFAAETAQLIADFKQRGMDTTAAEQNCSGFMTPAKAKLCAESMETMAARLGEQK